MAFPSKHGRADLRKGARKSLHYRAHIDGGDGMALHDCMVLDISDRGARLMIASPNEVPDDFTLLLSHDGHARRHCRVVWRTDQQIGVTFESGTQMEPGNKAVDAVLDR